MLELLVPCLYIIFLFKQAEQETKGAISQEEVKPFCHTLEIFD